MRATSEDASQAVRISIRTIQRWAKDGWVTSERWGRTLLVELADDRLNRADLPVRFAALCGEFSQDLSTLGSVGTTVRLGVTGGPGSTEIITGGMIWKRGSGSAGLSGPQRLSAASPRSVARTRTTTELMGNTSRFTPMSSLRAYLPLPSALQ